MKFHRKLSKEGTIVSMCVTGWKMADGDKCTCKRAADMLPVFRRYKIKNGAKTPINGYASFLFAFPSGNNW